MVDEARVRRLLDRLAAARHDLGRLRAMERREVRTDVDRLNSVKYLFILAAEVCIDVGNHVIASESLRAPESFSDIFAVLSEAEWIDDGLANRLAEMARFRNLLVHGYAQVDDDRVVEILHTNLGDLEDFAAAIGHATTAQAAEAHGADSD
jgi:uncharacterized protein YutE (UPF0331/DUF86 family)